MIEEITTQYINQTEIGRALILFGLFIAGGIAAAIFHKSSAELQRAPYFAYSSLLYVIFTVAGLIWLGSVPAIEGGFLWIFMLVDVVVGLSVGYAVGVLAMARSRDAFGHAWMAILAFIPIACFWLLFAPSKHKVSANRAPTIRLLSGGIGVLTGFVLLIAGGALSALIAVETTRMVAEAEGDPATESTDLEAVLRVQGVEKVLRQIAAAVPPQRVDETTVLQRVVGDGTTLRYIYEISTTLDTLPQSIRTGIVENNCTLEELRLLIEAGATIEHVYRRTDGSVIGAVAVTRDICGF